jgi:serine/threonine protein kinase
MIFLDLYTKVVDKVIKNYNLKPIFKNQFSDVYSDNSRKYILKIFNKENCIEKKTLYLTEKNYLTLFSNNKNITQHIPKIIQFNDKEKFILMEHRGRDGIILINDGAYNKRVFEDFIEQIPPVLEEIFKMGHVHRDIKPENLVYNTSTNTWSIIDFAFVEPLKCTGMKLTFRGSYPYCAPFLGNKKYMTDFLKHNNYEDIKVCADYFSFALTAFALEGKIYHENTLEHYVEVSISSAILTLLNPTTSPIKKALARIIISCVDLNFTTIKWFNTNRGGRRCQYGVGISCPEIKNLKVEKNMVKCWGEFMSIIEKRKVGVN